MPGALPAIGSFVAGLVGHAAIAVGITGSALTAIAGAAFIGAELATVGLVAKLLQPKKRGELGSTGTQLNFQADTQGGIPFILGRSATGSSLVFQYPSGPKNRFMNFFSVLAGGGPNQAIESFTANKETVNFDSDGTVTTGGSKYIGKMWMKTALGVAGAAALTCATAIAGTGDVAEWTSDHKLSGYAAARWTLDYDPTVYATGVPQPQWVVKGLKCYDPRHDSTYPGGSGSQRANDRTTWVWSENPYVHAITFCLGYVQNGKRVGGAGVPISMIDLPSFVDGANVADANEWKVGGLVTSLDAKWDVLSAILEAGGGTPVPNGALISCRVNAPRTSLATITEHDIKGPVTGTAVKSRRDRKNSYIPTYRSEDHDWEFVQASPVTAEDYQTEDGELRQEELKLELVQDAGQAAQLAAYALVNAREFGPITLPLKLSWLGYRRGDCLTVDLPRLGFNSQKVIVTNRNLDPVSGLVTITCESETDAKHAFALGQTPSPPPTPGLTAVDFITVAAPAADRFAAAAGYLTSGANAIPAITITGTADDQRAVEIIVEYRVHGTTDWILWATGPATQTSFTITGLDANQTYDISIRYRSVLGVLGARRIISSIVTGGVNVDNIGGIPVADILDEMDANGTELQRNALSDMLFRQVQNSLNYTGDGRKVQVVVMEALEKSDDAVEKVALIGVVNEDGTAIVFNADTVKLPDGITSLAQHLDYVESTLGDGTVTVSELKTAVDGQAGRVTITVDGNGHITGLNFGVDGDTTHFDIVAHNLRIIDPDAPGTFKVPFAYDGDTHQFLLTGDVAVHGDLVVTGTITTSKLIANAVTDFAASVVGSHTNVGTEYTVTSVSLNPEGGRVKVSYETNINNTGGTRAACRVKIYKDGTLTWMKGWIPDTAFGDWWNSFDIDETGDTASVTYTLTVQTVTGTSIGTSGGTPYTAADLGQGSLTVESFKK
jgi:hypothetical protein